VNVLQEAGLVTRRRSEGDRRRTYLHLDTRLLTAVFRPDLSAAGRVVFVCTQNSARSPIAAALWRKRTGQPVMSAGTRPAGRVHRRALRVAQEHDLAIEPTGTAHINDVVRDGDLIVAVCDSAHEELTGDIRPALHWSVPDPVAAGTDAAFKAAYDDLADRIELLAAALPPHEGA
jgi:ArsR family transcriptional regulator, arsenate/arsenite/antimonite-responsive transcriptional repressor / arsenate reductase (thioredoxin)